MPDLKNVEMGYVEPGHGMKGRKIWIHSDEDVKMMYEKHDKKRNILLWCYTAADTGSKEHKSNKPGKGGTKYQQHLEGQSAVDKIYEQLQEKHTTYSPRKLRAWANMVHLKTWTSIDEPPDKPFFKSRKRSTVHGEGSSTSKNPKLSSLSPGRKYRVRSELIDQLEKFHKLKESGALSSTEYDELRGTILSDIKNL